MKLLSLACIVGLASAVPLHISTAESVGPWTIDSANRTKSNNNTLCTWQTYVTVPSIATNVTAPPDGNATVSFACDFEVVTLPDEDCGTHAFEDVKCSGNAAFRASGGHSGFGSGFIVFVLANRDLRAAAYYGFDDGMLDTGTPFAPQISQTQAHTMKRDDGGHLPPIPAPNPVPVAGPDAAPGPEIVPDPAPAPLPVLEWTVENMYRRKWTCPFSSLAHASVLTEENPDVDPEMPVVHVNFTIRDTNSAVFPCALQIDGPNGTDLAVGQWYNKKCDGSDFFASWGYMEATDAGIMTLVNPTRDSEAFFGFNNISLSENLGTTPPSKVIPCDCD
ncbi:hypothetical protein F4780DRAFT_602402 [Xylariomycetidae sp. FL0641]|nr:hypothetical protein F4780DRAFT_602402 [Xylariomycetidae sp. FL0641]